MDSRTVIVVLALHLVATGGLLWLVGGRNGRNGLARFGVGSIVFGIAYVLRLLVGLVGSGGPLDILPDTAMVAALALFYVAVREFGGARVPRPGTVVSGVAVFVALRLAVEQAFGIPGRHVALNGVLALLFVAVAHAAADAARRSEPGQRLPFAILAGLLFGLGALTAGRALDAALNGVGVLFAGVYSQIYYGYSSFVAVLLGPMLLWAVFVRMNRQLAELATHDALTRLLNRNGLDEVLRRHFASRHDPSPLVFLQLDLDHFKRINDRHGHAAGDEVLRGVADVLRTHVRGGDFVARTGGEEFLIGCVGADAGTAARLAERLCDAVAELAVSVPGVREKLRCTASVGVSRPFDRLDGWPAAAREADAALYHAKGQGRDRIVFAGVGDVAPGDVPSPPPGPT